MHARVLPMGAGALVVEVADTGAALALRAHLDPYVEQSEGIWSAVDHVVLGARSLLVVLRQPTRRAEVGRACLGRLPCTSTSRRRPESEDVVEVEVRYDGPDLEEVARLTDLSPDEVVLAHTSTPWRVGFGGFAPGFAYLVGGDPRLAVPRRSEPRASVPAGSVALAGEFSGIYPHASPGGWQLLGTTDAVLWDVDRDPPSLLAPGRSVRFVAVDASAPSSGPVVPVAPTSPTPQPSRGRARPEVRAGRPTGQVSVASRSLPPVRSPSSRTPAVLAWPAWEWGVPARPTPRHTCSVCASWGTCSTSTTHPSAPRRRPRSRSRSEACRSVPMGTCSSR